MPTTSPPKRLKTGGGSRKGKPNKKTALTRAGIQALCDKHGYNPWEAMIVMAQNPTTDDTTRFQCHKEIAQFILPKLRSVELTGDETHPLYFAAQVKISLDEALRKAYDIQAPHRNGQAPHFGIVAASANGR